MKNLQNRVHVLERQVQWFKGAFVFITLALGLTQCQEVSSKLGLTLSGFETVALTAGLNGGEIVLRDEHGSEFVNIRATPEGGELRLSSPNGGSVVLRAVNNAQIEMRNGQSYMTGLVSPNHVTVANCVGESNCTTLTTGESASTVTVIDAGGSASLSSDHQRAGLWVERGETVVQAGFTGKEARIMVDNGVGFPLLLP